MHLVGLSTRLLHLNPKYSCVCYFQNKNKYASFIIYSYIILFCRFCLLLRVISATELKSVHSTLLRNDQTEKASKRWCEMDTFKAFKQHSRAASSEPKYMLQTIIRYPENTLEIKIIH
jgi:hypothetical protein